MGFDVVDFDVDVGAAVSRPRQALVGEHVRSLVGLQAHVSRHPFDDDGDGEVADELLDLLGEGGVGARAPAEGENTLGELVVCEDVELFVGVGVGE